MKAFVSFVAIVLSGYATAEPPLVPRDYIMRLKEPVVFEAYLVPVHSMFGGLRLVDSAGRYVTVYRDFGGHEGDLILGDFRHGRRVDYGGDEGAKLLKILDHFGSDADHMGGAVSDFARIIREKRQQPNQSPEPTAPSGRGSS